MGLLAEVAPKEPKAGVLDVGQEQVRGVVAAGQERYLGPAQGAVEPQLIGPPHRAVGQADKEEERTGIHVRCEQERVGRDAAAQQPFEGGAVAPAALQQ